MRDKMEDTYQRNSTPVIADIFVIIIQVCYLHINDAQLFSFLKRPSGNVYLQKLFIQKINRRK